MLHKKKLQLSSFVLFLPLSHLLKLSPFIHIDVYYPLYKKKTNKNPKLYFSLPHLYSLQHAQPKEQTGQASTEGQFPTQETSHAEHEKVTEPPPSLQQQIHNVRSALLRRDNQQGIYDPDELEQFCVENGGPTVFMQFVEMKTPVNDARQPDSYKRHQACMYAVQV